MAGKPKNTPRTTPPTTRGLWALIATFAGILLVIVAGATLALKFLAPGPTVAPSVLQEAAKATLELAMPIYVDETVRAELPGLLAGTLTALAPTPSPIPPTPTLPVIPCDLAGFVADETIPDGMHLSSANAFTKVWKVRNMGTCAWAEDYALVFAGGELMAGQSPLTIGRTLNPGDTIELSANLMSPAAGGVYRSEWLLQNSSGTQFGLSPDNHPLTLQISVGAHETIALNFAKDVCTARWASPLGSLNCPNPDELILGSVNPFDNTVAEYGEVVDQPGIEMVPSEGSDGSVTGTYNLLLIQDEDIFHAIVGCSDNQPDCNLIFQLLVDTGDHQPALLGQWHETSDGALQKIDVDLSPMTGKAVRLILQVISKTGTGVGNKGIWVSPVLFRTLK